MSTAPRELKYNEYDPGGEPPPRAERPLCPSCGKPLRPWIDVETTFVGTGAHIITTGRRWSKRYHAYGAFCTLACCERYANKAYEILGNKGRRA
jgi:hypothetical protein